MSSPFLYPMKLSLAMKVRFRESTYVDVFRQQLVRYLVLLQNVVVDRRAGKR